MVSQELSALQIFSPKPGMQFVSPMFAAYLDQLVFLNLQPTNLREN